VSPDPGRTIAILLGCRVAPWGVTQLPIMTAVRLHYLDTKGMTKICRVFVALFTVGGDKASGAGGGKRSAAPLAVLHHPDRLGFNQRRTLQFYRH